MTSNPYGTLDLSAHLSHLRSAAAGFQAALARTDPDAMVPSCPGWTVHGLVEHLGRVHQWARAIVVNGTRPDNDTLPRISAGEDLADWYAAQLAPLADTLQTTDPDKPCWTHQPSRPVASYWSRRQAHETAMHRLDLELAAGLPLSYDDELAADGIGEVLDVWMPLLRSRTNIQPDVPAPVLLTCTDRPDRWLITPGSPDPGTAGPTLTDAAASKASAEIRGSAQALLLTLWKRLPGDVDVHGSAAERFLASTLTP